MSIDSILVSCTWLSNDFEKEVVIKCVEVFAYSRCPCLPLLFTYDNLSFCNAEHTPWRFIEKRPPPSLGTMLTQGCWFLHPLKGFKWFQTWLTAMKPAWNASNTDLLISNGLCTQVFSCWITGVMMVALQILQANKCLVAIKEWSDANDGSLQNRCCIVLQFEIDRTCQNKRSFKPSNAKDQTFSNKAMPNSLIYAECWSRMKSPETWNLKPSTCDCVTVDMAGDTW